MARSLALTYLIWPLLTHLPDCLFLGLQSSVSSGEMTRLPSSIEEQMGNDQNLNARDAQDNSEDAIVPGPAEGVDSTQPKYAHALLLLNNN